MSIHPSLKLITLYRSLMICSITGMHVRSSHFGIHSCCCTIIQRTKWIMEKKQSGHIKFTRHMTWVSRNTIIAVYSFGRWWDNKTCVSLFYCMNEAMSLCACAKNSLARCHCLLCSMCLYRQTNKANSFLYSEMRKCGL